MKLYTFTMLLSSLLLFGVIPSCERGQNNTINQSPSDQPVVKEENKTIKNSPIDEELAAEPSPAVPTEVATPDGMTLQEAKKQKPPPPYVVDVEATAKGVHFRWKALRGRTVSYNIYRKDSSANFKKVESKKVDQEVEWSKNGVYEFIDMKVRAETTYTYAVTAVNYFGNESKLSKPVTITFK